MQFWIPEFNNNEKIYMELRISAHTKENYIQALLLYCIY